MKKDIELGQEKDPGKWAGTMTRDEDRDMDWKRDKVKDRDMVKVGTRTRTGTRTGSKRWIET